MRAKVAKITMKGISEHTGVPVSTLRRWKKEGRFNLDDFWSVVKLSNALQLMSELGFWKHGSEFRQ